VAAAAGEAAGRDLYRCAGNHSGLPDREMLGKKVIYIESFARIDGPSLTGKLLYKVADATIIQWPELKRFYPNAIYGGSIY
jgi:hypothetical protein